MANRQLFFGLAMVAAGLSAGPAAAQTSSLTCTNDGVAYKIGETACIAACHGTRQLARCERVAESTTWTYVSDVCPSAGLAPVPPANASQIPKTALMTPLPAALKTIRAASNISVSLAALKVGTFK